MGSYIQVGICTEIVVDKAQLAQVGLSREELIAWLGADFMDLSVFELQEDGEAPTAKVLPSADKAKPYQVSFAPVLEALM
jgi:hypothetical protein